jgi:hypothetical protein
VTADPSPKPASAPALPCSPTGTEHVTTDKPDYAPEETVHMTGSGFAPSCVVRIEVTRPDGSVVKGDGSFTPGTDAVTTSATGTFAYDYRLDGVIGEYAVRVLGDKDALLASTVFADSPCTAIGAVLVGATCELSANFNVTANLAVTLDPGLSLHILGPAGAITVSPGVTFSLTVPGPDGILIDAGRSVTGNATTTGGVGATIDLVASGGAITVNGVVSSNQSAGSCTGGSAGTVTLTSLADLDVGATGSATANGSPCSGGHVTLTAGNDVNLSGGALVSATQGGGSPSGATGGTIDIFAGGNLAAAAGSTITVNAGPRPAGAITIDAPNGTIELDGSVLSQSGNTGNGLPGGGPISVVAGCSLTVGGTVSSRGNDPGADLVHLEGCDVTITGLVESTGAGHAPPPGTHCRETPPNATACVEVVAHGTLTISGQINADLCCAGGTEGTSWIDLFAASDISIVGGATYAVHANENMGTGGTGSQGGVVRVWSVGGSVLTTGLAIAANGIGGGGDGGTIDVQSGGTTTVAFGTASVQALGGTSGTGPTGGVITARSFNGEVTGTAPGVLSTAATAVISGTVTLQGCTPPPGVAYTGTVIGTLTILPPTCGGAPTLPAYIGPLAPCPVCNPGSITIVKVSNPESPATFDFTASSTPPATTLVPSTFTLQDNGDPNDGISNVQAYTGLAPGLYTFTELATPGFAVDIVCTEPSPSVGGGVSVTLMPEQDVVCLFTNTQLGSVTIAKDAVPNGPTQFSFSVVPDTVTPSSFTLDDDGSPTPFPNSQLLDGVVTGTTYTVTEAAASGFDLVAIECTGGQTAVDIPGHSVAITFTAGDDIVCTFVNVEPETIELGPELAAEPGAPAVSGGAIAFTGSNAWTPLAIALALVVLGGGLVIVSRRRSSPLRRPRS